ncbi:MAG: ABC transporter ATP-binding protein [SAR324 cluster bacterium]|uniref:ABC transporter ATP-binding protein n=1 Tax=SAR324 cluster bacterium TaxID=2024889 RepID=A0A7X9IIX4_9DELT|nr:ABC transporter ATP-binding protein [SAR324 cluster bacterium]
MLIVDKLCKDYGKFRAVNEVSFNIMPGEIFGFLGVNGAGKTTTLRMLAGVLRPSSGSIQISKFNMATEPIQAKQITGYIPDRPYMYNKLTGREFLYFICELYKIKAEIAEERIDKLLGEYSLKDWQDELIESYSHGMKQRLATCSALVHEPQLLIVDEPMVGLDPHGAKFLKESFKQYAKKGTSILLSTHTLSVAEELADRIAIIHKGAILTVGTLAEIRALVGGTDEGLENIFINLTSSAM